MTAHRKAPVPSVSAYRPTVPAQLDAVLQRMLAKRPTQRYQRPAEVVAALEPFTHGCDLVELVTKADVPHSDTNPRADDVTLAFRSLCRWVKTRLDRRKFALVAGLVGSLGLLGAATSAYLATRPERVQLIFSGESTDVLWDYDQQIDLLRARTLELALFSLGSRKASTYSISIDLSQPNWHGEAGLFFDHGTLDHEKHTDHTMQIVGLRQRAKKQASPAFEVFRSGFRICLARGHNNRPWKEYLKTKLVASPVSVSRSDGLHNLIVVVSNGRVQRVEWDGQELPELATHNSEGQSDQIDATGDFGVFNKAGLTSFQNFKVE